MTLAIKMKKLRHAQRRKRICIIWDPPLGLSEGSGDGEKVASASGAVGTKAGV